MFAGIQSEGEHLKREDQRGYSLIMSAFQGKFRLFQETIEREVQRVGIAAFSLCLRPETLPAEIASGLDAVSAPRIAAVLEEIGATITVVPTREVIGVRTLVDECWPSRSVGHWHFSDVEGLVLTLTPLNARKNVEQMKARRPEVKGWEIEAALNHQHPTNEYSRRALRSARRMGANLATALEEAYPERSFIVDYWDEQISFYQQGNGAPEHDEPPPTMQDKTWCEVCRGSRAYRLRLEMDAEFPRADWGECAECGGEVLVRCWRLRTRV